MSHITGDARKRNDEADDDAGVAPEQAAVAADVEWLLSLVLARYSYGDVTWVGLDPEERNAIAEGYLRRAREIAPMVTAALAANLPADDGARAAITQDWYCETCGERPDDHRGGGLSGGCVLRPVLRPAFADVAAIRADNLAADQHSDEAGL